MNDKITKLYAFNLYFDGLSLRKTSKLYPDSSREVML